VGLCQISVCADVAVNYRTAEAAVKNAASLKANVVVLPEVWNSPYGTKYFQKYAEAIPDGKTVQKMSQWAKDFNITLIGGSIPEV
jgi:omega-amidase